MLDVQGEVNRAVGAFVADVLRQARGEVVRLLEGELDRWRALDVVDAATASLLRLRSSRAAGRPLGANAPKRTAGELRGLEQRFIAFVRANPGLRIEQINEQLATETRDLRLPVAKLVASGVITTRGAKRSRRYFAGDHARCTSSEQEPARSVTSPLLVAIEVVIDGSVHQAEHVVERVPAVPERASKSGPEERELAAELSAPGAQHVERELAAEQAASGTRSMERELAVARAPVQQVVAA